MSYDDKISQIIKNHKLKHRLQEIGIYPNMGVKKMLYSVENSFGGVEWD